MTLLIRLLFLLLFVQSSYANTTPDQLRAAIQQFVLGGMNSSLSDPKVDFVNFPQNLQLADCANIQVSYRDPSQEFHFGEKTVVASCASPYWQLYLLVNLHGKVPVVFSRVAILQKTQLSPDLFVIKNEESNDINGQYFSDPTSIENGQARNYIPANVPIRPEMVEQTFLIHRGTAVSITDNSAGVYVKMNGIAQDDGMKGQTIRVKNMNSGRLVEGVVVDGSTVSVE